MRLIVTLVHILNFIFYQNVSLKFVELVTLLRSGVSIKRPRQPALLAAYPTLLVMMFLCLPNRVRAPTLRGGATVRDGLLLPLPSSPSASPTLAHIVKLHAGKTTKSASSSSCSD